MKDSSGQLCAHLTGTGRLDVALLLDHVVHIRGEASGGRPYRGP